MYLGKLFQIRDPCSALIQVCNMSILQEVMKALDLRLYGISLWVNKEQINLGFKKEVLL